MISAPWMSRRKGWCVHKIWKKIEYDFVPFHTQAMVCVLTKKFATLPRNNILFFFGTD
jgi:hypothetical protein